MTERKYRNLTFGDLLKKAALAGVKLEDEIECWDFNGSGNADSIELDRVEIKEPQIPAGPLLPTGRFRIVVTE